MSKYRDRRQKIQDRHQSKSLDDIVFLESGKKIGKCFIFFRNYLKHGERHTPTFRVNIIFPTFYFQFFTEVVLRCF